MTSHMPLFSASRKATFIVRVGRMPWLETGETYTKHCWNLRTKGRAIKGFFVFDIARNRRSVSTLLSTVPRGINEYPRIESIFMYDSY